LLDIQNIKVQGLNFIQYKIQQPNGDLEYAVSFSAGIKSGRSTYSIQSDWLMPDYASEDTMFNYQLWAASPVDVNTMVTEVLGKLQSNKPLVQLTNNDLPSAYVSAASRQGTNLNLTVNNRTANTSGYFTLTQKSNEITSVSDNIVVPFTVNANGKTVVSIPVGDSYDANISMVFNNTTTDMLYMADGIWGTSSDNQTTVSQFNVSNDNNRTYPDNEYALLRDVQVQVTTPSYLSIYKYLKGGAVAANLSAYKSFHFTTNTNAEGMNLQVTITKQSVTNWNSQYTYTINNYQDGQTYKLALSDFKSTDSTLPAVIDASDITSVVYNVINPTGQSVSITTGISNAAFSTEDIAYENSLQAKAVSVSPNPNNGNFKVSFSSPSAAQLQLRVIDVAGKVISTMPVNAIAGKNEVSVNIGQAVKGSVYFVTLEGVGMKYNTKEMIIKK
jgi:Secretion system C-terminal sorting domain